MKATAYGEDANEHENRDDLVASGTVETFAVMTEVPRSRRVPRIDDNGVKNQSVVSKRE